MKKSLGSCGLRTFWWQACGLQYFLLPGLEHFLLVLLVSLRSPHLLRLNHPRWYCSCGWPVYVNSCSIYKNQKTRGHLPVGASQEK